MPIPAAKVISAVLILGAGSVLGYNWITTGCPTGVCPSTHAKAAAVQTVALPVTDAKDACCPLTAQAETPEKLPACCAHLGEAACGDPSMCVDMAAPDAQPGPAQTQPETTAAKP